MVLIEEFSINAIFLIKKVRQQNFPVKIKSSHLDSNFSNFKKRILIQAGIISISA